MQCLDRFNKRMSRSGGSLREEYIFNTRELLKDTIDKSSGKDSSNSRQMFSRVKAKMSSQTTTAVGLSFNFNRLVITSICSFALKGNSMQYSGTIGI